jgi:hypothetical protein
MSNSIIFTILMQRHLQISYNIVVKFIAFNLFAFTKSKVRTDSIIIVQLNLIYEDHRLYENRMKFFIL